VRRDDSTAAQGCHDALSRTAPLFLIVDPKKAASCTPRRPTCYAPAPVLLAGRTAPAPHLLWRISQPNGFSGKPLHHNGIGARYLHHRPAKKAEAGESR